jgi:hypothetical protein
MGLYFIFSQLVGNPEGFSRGEWSPALNEREGKDTFEQPLSQDSITLAYVAAMVLQISAIQKQILLEIDSSEGLFDRLLFFYRREVPLLRAILKEDRSEQGSSFSRN